jgi:hypothetical protein
VFREKTKASSDADSKRCPACGGDQSRSSARFCADCGKLLAEDYQPLDTLRASYRLQRQTLEIDRGMEIKTALFDVETSAVTQTAWACVVYSMVPYLGILFIPFAFAISWFGFISARTNVAQNRRLAALCIGLSVAILLVQIGLWWLLYLIPKISQGVPIAN